MVLPSLFILVAILDLWVGVYVLLHKQYALSAIWLVAAVIWFTSAWYAAKNRLGR